MNLGKITHSYSSEITAPTCTAEGYTTYTCDTCGFSYIGNRVTKKAHTISASYPYVAPTCTQQGNNAYWKCGTCNKHYAGDVNNASEIDPSNQVIAAKGHSPETDPAIPATCTQLGKSEGSHCSVCGVTLKEQTNIYNVYKQISEDVFQCNICGSYAVLENYIVEHNGSKQMFSIKLFDKNGVEKNIQPTITYNGSAFDGATAIGEYNITVAYANCNLITLKFIILGEETETVAVLKNGNTYTNYTSIEAALSAAVSGNIVYVLPQLTTYISSSCEIKQGVTLILPYTYDTSNNTAVYKEEKDLREPLGIHAYDNPSINLISLVTVLDGVRITNNGNLTIGGQTTGGNGGHIYAGATCGLYAQMTLLGNASIENSGTIDCYGYIKATASGSKIINTGIIYSPFIVMEHRGGSVFYAMKDNMPESPFNRFFMPNIIGTTIYQYGSKLFGRANLYAEGDHKTNIELISTSEKSLISMHDNSLIKTYYDDQTEITTLDVYGSFTFNPLSISITVFVVMNVDLSTEDVFFPISHYFNINLHKHMDGTEATVSASLQDIKLLPGAKLTIDEEVTLIAKNLVVYNKYDVEYIDGSSGGVVGKLIMYPQTFGEAILINNGTLIANDLAGYIQSSAGTGKLVINGNTTLKTYHLNQSTGSNFSTKVGYYEATHTLNLNYYNGTITNRCSINNNGTYYALVINGNYCWVNSQYKVPVWYNTDNYLNYGSEVTNTNPNEIQINAEYFLVEPTFDNEFISFVGWYDNPELIGNTIDIIKGYDSRSGITLYGKWTELKKYNITFNTDGGSLVRDQPVIENTCVNKPDNPTKEGYTFVDWYSDSSFTNKYDFNTKVTSGFTLYAKWQVNQYTITFNTDGGSSIESITANYGTPINVPANPTKSGWKFTGWSPSIPETMPAKNMTITATWKEDSCFAVGTPILLSNGQYKNIEEIQAGEYVYAWDFFTGKLVVTPVAAVVSHGDSTYEIINLEFSNGDVIKVISKHGFYMSNTNEFIYIDKNNYSQLIGEKFKSIINSEVVNSTLVNAYITYEFTTSYTIVTAKCFNVFACNMLTLSPCEIFDGIFTYFDTNENMMYDESQINEYISLYGLSEYEEWKDYVSEEIFYALNCQYFNICIGKGIATKEEIIYLLQAYLS